MSLMSICPLAHKIILACTFLKYKLDSPFWRQYLFLRTKKRPETYFISLGFRCPCQGVDATGFEPATSASRTQRSTKLSHASLMSFAIQLDYNNIILRKKQVLFLLFFIFSFSFICVHFLISFFKQLLTVCPALCKSIPHRKTQRNHQLLLQPGYAVLLLFLQRSQCLQ